MHSYIRYWYHKFVSIEGFLDNASYLTLPKFDKSKLRMCAQLNATLLRPATHGAAVRCGAVRYVTHLKAD